MAGRWTLLAGCALAAMSTMGFSGHLGVAGQATEAAQYVYALVVLGIAALAGLGIWWWTDGRSRPKEAGPASARTGMADDLTRIEGIGPKISGLLQEAGISTFAKLAEANVDFLREIISNAGLTALSDPGSWPEQASLAAKGEWKRLEALQEELKGGRRE
jgi:hypothetical protein